MKGSTCYFIGHADAREEIFPELIHLIEQHITEYGVHTFFFGNHGNYDRLVLRALRDVKERYPHIRRIMVLAYHPTGNAHFSTEDADELFYPFEEAVLPRFAILEANKRMIRDCDYLIAYVWHTGKSRDFLEYAQKREAKGLIHVTNIDRKPVK